ncbi:hypothetical protein IWC96_03190 [Brevundimonas sp. BAL450]|uniref:Uncharacterized protein n=1 Tax=Brevundimonas abyssalis TAR-001 TaxID=1391729 RepID=A0A8E0NDN9_9CAUL|nr:MULTISPECIES: hypothetical protein [Brevundimonas]MBG7614288.1 hypothetical protein [Brevundimonas sp. BAL450]GAD60463.1 hypothetical protein MBEBAB_2713 [Brevundimonas abyssalis TAR-001]
MIGLFAALALLSPAPEAGDGPWRQLIDFNPTAERPDGVSLFLRQADMLPQGTPRSWETRMARHVWVNHGAVVGGQAWTVIDSAFDCAGGGVTQTVRAYDAQGRLLGEAQPNEDTRPVPHSAEHMVWDAVCMGSPYLYDKPVVATLAEATADAATGDGLAALTDELQWDVDYDGQADIIRIHMRPHSMRHDVEFILARDPTRPITVITAEQPPTGPLVQRGIRRLERDRYLTACAMDQGADVQPCEAAYPFVQRGVEVVAEGQPTILVWLVSGEPHVARLPAAE